MLEKNQKTMAVVFRACIFAAFFVGVMYVVRFIKAPKSRLESFAAVCTLYYFYLALMVASLALSVVCFKTTKAAASVVRTIALAFNVIALFSSMSVINLMNKTVAISRSGDLEAREALAGEMGRMMNNTHAMSATLLSFVSVFVMLILTITSAVALVKILTGKNKATGTVNS